MEHISGIIIQARTGSTRLKNKIFLPLIGELSIMDILTMRLSHSFNNLPIVIATTDNIGDDIIQQYCEEHGFNYFRGNEHNVLKRFIDCTEKFAFTNKVVRVCADNPFLDMGLLQQLIDKSDEKADYVTYTVNTLPVIRTHFGFFAELVSVNALYKIQMATQDRLYQEHVTNYIYSHPSEFNIQQFEMDELKEYNDKLRLTIDSKVDFEHAAIILKKLYDGGCGITDYNYKEVIAATEEEYEILSRMKNTISSNLK